MAKDNKKIEVSIEVRKKIARTFGVTLQSVGNALRYDSEKGYTDLAKRIRIMALQNGGHHVVSWPECETIHVESTGEMIQTFENGARLVLNKKTNYGVIYTPKGEPYMGQSNVTLNQIGVMQDIAATL